MREPERASTHGGIFDSNGGLRRPVGRIIGGHHPTMPAEELEPISRLDCG